MLEPRPAPRWSLGWTKVGYGVVGGSSYHGIAPCGVFPPTEGIHGLAEIPFSLPTETIPSACGFCDASLITRLLRT